MLCSESKNNSLQTFNGQEFTLPVKAVCTGFWDSFMGEYGEYADFNMELVDADQKVLHTWGATNMPYDMASKVSNGVIYKTVDELKNAFPECIE